MEITRKTRPSRTVAVTAVLVLAGGLSACTDMSGSNTKAGGDSAPVTLAMGTDDTAGLPAAKQIDEFARQVRERSGGALVIEPRLQAAGPSQSDWDQKVARQVVDGELDLGMIPTRAWDTEGVDSLRALNTPFLITSDAALAKVVTNDGLATDLLGGLEGVGVAGLALVPEGLRHFFLYKERALGRDTLRGAVVRSPHSDTTWALIEALGAEPTDASTEQTFSAAESSFALAPGGPARTAVGNLTLFPKVNVVAVNAEVLAGLTHGQRKVLREAALATRDWAVENNQADRDQAAAWCADGMGDVTNASSAVVASVHSAARTVVAELRRNVTTAALIDRIAKMTDNAAQSSVQACHRGEPGTYAPDDSVEPTGGDLPDGTYRAEYTDTYLRSRVRVETNVASNHGTWTFELKDGHWTFDQVAPDITDHSEGVYEVRGDDLFWALSEGQVLHFRWWTDDDGDLHFDQYHDLGADADPNYPFPDFQFDLEWVRVS